MQTKAMPNGARIGAAGRSTGGKLDLGAARILSVIHDDERTAYGPACNSTAASRFMDETVRPGPHTWRTGP
jgi:hypothetical protein